MKLLKVVVALLYFLPASAQEFSKSWKDLNYAGDTMHYHLLDVYLPAVEKPGYPVVVVVYGSAWLGNNLKGADLKTLGKVLLEEGFAVVMPNHRSSRDALFPAQIQDIKAVIRFLRANAGRFRLDTSFIGITGSSSGGHLAALTGTSINTSQYLVGTSSVDLEGKIGNNPGFSSAVNAVVDWFGPTNFLVMDSCGSSMQHNAPHSPESSLIGGPIQDNKAKVALADPATYVDQNDPPFLLLHGDKDPLVPHCQSEWLYDALQAAGVPSKLVIVPGGQHGRGMFEPQYFRMMTDFFREQLRRQ